MRNDHKGKAEGGNPWLFQSNPKQYDFLGELETKKPGDGGDWTVSRFWKDMKAGDKVVFWMAGSSAGVYALGELTGDAYTRDFDPSPEDLQDKRYLKNIWRVNYCYTHILEDPITRDEVKAHPVLRDLGVLKFPNATNFKVTPEQWQALNHLISQLKSGQGEKDSPDRVAEFVQNLYPDEVIRREALGFLADSICHTNAHRNSSWALTGPKQGYLQLNISNLLAIRLASSDVWATIDTQLLNGDERARLKKYFISWQFSKYPQLAIPAIPIEHLSELLPITRHSHLTFVEDAAILQKRSTQYKNHSSQLIEYLRTYLGRPDIPNPDYGLFESRIGTVKDSGAFAGDLLIGMEDCNAGLLLRVYSHQKAGRGGQIIGRFDLLDSGHGTYAKYLKKLENEQFSSSKELIAKVAPLIGVDNMQFINCNMLAVYIGEDEEELS